MSRELKDLIEEFYRLELIVMTAPAPTSQSTTTSASTNQKSQTLGQAPSTSLLPRGSVSATLEVGGVGGSTTPQPSSSTSVSPHHHHHHHGHTSFTTTTASFINHHANRLKSKLVPNTITSSSTIGSGAKLANLSSQWTSQKNTLIIMANAAAIELYFLCIEDESDAEKLCTKCSEKFFLSHMSLSETILQAPLIASCIQVLTCLLGFN